MRVLLAGSSALALGAVVVLAGSAYAAPRAPVTVTIKAEGTDMSGTVKSAVPSCAADRTVVVFKQKGSRGGGDDVRFASDTTGLQGSKYVWSTGNTGTEGRFYAKLKATSGCKAAVSRTIRVQRTD